MKYETQSGLPTRGLTYSQLCEHLIKAQELCALMAHLHQTEGNPMDKTLASGWLGVSELLKRMNHQVTQLAKGAMQ